MLAQFSEICIGKTERDEISTFIFTFFTSIFNGEKEGDPPDAEILLAILNRKPKGS